MSEVIERGAMPFLDRTPAVSVPELKQFLKHGNSVLDIGCGPGTITLDVAEIVKPGNVVGVDPMKDRIEVATQLAGQRELAAWRNAARSFHFWACVSAAGRA